MIHTQNCDLEGEHQMRQQFPLPDIRPIHKNKNVYRFKCLINITTLMECVYPGHMKFHQKRN